MMDYKKSLQSYWRVTMVFVVIIFIASSLTYVHINKEKTRQYVLMIDQLGSIAGNKAERFSRLYDQYYNEALLLSNNYFFTTVVNQIVNGDYGEADHLNDFLTKLKVYNNYDNIYILDNDCKLLYSVDTVFKEIDTITMRMVYESIESGYTQIKDFYYCPTHEKIHFEIISPVKDNSGKVTAAIVLRIDPNDFIYPMLMDLRITSSTAETFLVRIEDDSLRILNNLRNMDNSRLRFSVSLGNNLDPLVRLVMGQSDILEEADYTGNSCIWKSEHVVGTPWYLIIKINTDEVYEVLEKDILLLLLIVFLLVLLSILALVILYNNHRSRTFQELLEKKELLFQSQEEYKKILYSIGEGVITTDNTGLIRHLNPMAEQLTGWKENEAEGRMLEDVFRIFEEDLAHPVKGLVSRIDSLGKVKGSSDSTLMISKGGNELFVRYSCAPIMDSKGNLLGVIILFSDNTDRQLRRRMLDLRLRFIEFSFNNGTKETMAFMLDEMGSFLKSPVGLFFFYESEKRLLTLKACSTYIQQKYGINGCDNPLKLKETENFSEVILKGDTVIFKDFSFFRNEIFGLNTIEADINQILAVPIIRNKNTIGIVVLGNNNIEYSERDIGTASFLVDVSWNIVEQKIKDFLLLKSEERFEHLFERAPLGYQSLDKEGYILEVNSAWEDTLGYHKDEAIGKWFGDFVVPEERGLLEKRFADFKAAGTTHVEYNMIHKSGERRIISFEGKIGYDVKGEFEKTHCILNDITQNKVVEEQLRKSEEQNRLVKENIMDAILLAKPDGSILSVNRAACEMFGKSENEIIEGGRGGIVSISDPRLPEFLSIIEKQGFARSELTLVRKGGTLFPAEVSTSLFMTSKGESFTSVIIRDLTKQKETENEIIRAKEKAEESDRLKSAFLANVSHEIRTPMNGLLGFIELLQQPELDNEEKDLYMNIVNKSGQRLLNTINDIIEISRIDAGESEIRPEEFSLDELMEYHKDFFKQQANEKGIEIVIEQAIRGESAILFVDKHKLDGVLTNLIKNAIKFTDKGKITIGNYIEDKSVVFYIKDTGRGIPPQKIDTIFERFTQADDEFNRKYEGSGLGLSIAKAYVKLLGGEIWVDSELNKGSTFYFSILYIMKPD